MKSAHLTAARGTILAATALGSVLAVCVGTPQAQAQFVCIGNATGATVGPATANGASATADLGPDNFACGVNANASGSASHNTATGFSANASGDMSFNTATGDSANASGTFGGNTATGFGANASGIGGRNIATGFSANASGDRSLNIATGYSADASGTFGSNIATGPVANASGVSGRNIATGSLANASGDNSSNIAIGSNAVATDGSTTGTNNTAVGNSSSATGLNSSAFGNGASATFANSAAFGNGATTTRANQQVFGTAGNTYTTPGITSAASKSAQTGQTQLVTSDASGNLATSTLAGLGLASSVDLSAINSQIGNLSSRVDTLTSESRAGTALALAASGLHYDPRPGKASLAAAYGTFKGQSGMAVGLGYAVSDRFRVNGAFTGTPQVNDYGLVAGGSWTLN